MTYDPFLPRLPRSIYDPLPPWLPTAGPNPNPNPPPLVETFYAPGYGPGYGNDMVVPTAGPNPNPDRGMTIPVATSGLDLGGLLGGEILGIPSWLVIGAVAYFMFFRKGR